MNDRELLELAAKASETSSMVMDLIRHIAGLYSGKAIKGDFTQIYITGNEIWMAQQILASQQVDQEKNHEQAEISQAERDAFEAHESKERRLSPADQRFWFRRGVVADYDCKSIDDAWKAWKARAALSQPHANRQWYDFDDWLVWELESDSNQQFEYPAYALQLARRAFKCAQLQPASELEQSVNFLAEERDIARMIAVGMAHILKAISKNRNAVIPPEVHQSISEVLDIYGVHFPSPPSSSPHLDSHAAAEIGRTMP